MPNSIRERILQALVDKLARVAIDPAATVHRSPTVAIEREQCPALVLFPEADQITERPNDRVVRQLTIKVVALARAVAPEMPEPLADALLVAAHRAILADVNLGGLCLGIAEMDAEYDVEDADAEACAIPQRYRITYRTMAADLSVLG
jgi:hypothetical protein